MSAQSTSLLGYGLYFIDVLACMLFCITLALVGARFSHEQTVPIELPRMERSDAAGADLSGRSIVVRSHAGELQILLDEEPVTLEELEAKLRSSAPPSVVLRSEDSPIARVIGIAHAAGVRNIQLAYEAERSAERPR